MQGFIYLIQLVYDVISYERVYRPGATQAARPPVLADNGELSETLKTLFRRFRMRLVPSRFLPSPTERKSSLTTNFWVTLRPH
jgi:hypothetical protein